MRILIIEDEFNLADVIAARLRQEHYEAEICQDGDEGLYLASAGIYDLILLDVMLPGKDGFEILRELRQQGMAFLEALPLRMPLNYLAGRAWQQKGFERPEAILLVRMLQLLVRDLIMCKLSLDNKIYNCDLQGELLELAKNWQLSALKAALRHIQEAYAALENSVGVRPVLEAMALKIDLAYKE